jgi:PPM family protein phosphatase
MMGATDTGLVRKSNQDAYFCSAEYGLAIVSDGMGGHKGGEIASQLVVTGLRDAYLRENQILVDQVGAFLDEVLQRINLEILKQGKEDEALRGMGATVNYLQFAGGDLAIGHAGDSRTYLIRSFLRPDEKIRFGMWCLTIDHNVGTFVDRGLLIPGRDVPEGALSERQRARLMRGMGVQAELKADLYCRQLQEGDVYLTCSDGLHGFVSDKEVLKVLVSTPISECALKLIALAHKAGAPDNVSVVAEHEEPLLLQKEIPTGIDVFKRPFLARKASGKIFGPFEVEKIIELWKTGQLEGSTDVCATLDDWITLQNKSALFKKYPEFNTPDVRELLNFISPDSAVELESRIPSDTRSTSVLSSKVENASPWKWYLFIGMLLVGTLLIVIYFMKDRRKDGQNIPGSADVAVTPSGTHDAIAPNLESPK